jgi:hypothetical protein
MVMDIIIFRLGMCLEKTERESLRKLGKWETEV